MGRNDFAPFFSRFKWPARSPSRNTKEELDPLFLQGENRLGVWRGPFEGEFREDGVFGVALTHHRQRNSIVKKRHLRATGI